MHAHSENPTSNEIPPGISEEVLAAAIATSGYPLQGEVATILQASFEVIEEWGYVDETTKEQRSLDVFGFRALTDAKDASVQPVLNLFVECKRSTHPFVFFKQVVDRIPPRFPLVDGTPRNSVYIHQGTMMSEVGAAAALGLDEESFVVDSVPYCSLFAKAVPNGKKVELSGSEPFNAVVLPLVKAMRFSMKSHTPGQNDRFFPSLKLCLAVLDAPMLLVESPETASSPILRPWVRVVRHESWMDAHSYRRGRYYAIDVVHVDYLPTFVAKALLPFANTFALRAIDREQILRHGGDAPMVEKWRWDEVTPRTGS